jgi:hypothetical protein
MGDFIARSSLKWAKTPPYPPNVHVRDLDSYDGFSTGFERVSTDSPGSAKGGASRFPWIDRFYFRKDSDNPDYYDLAARCHVSDSRTTCILHFSLRCSPKIYVTVVGLDGTYLPRSAEIKSDVDEFVSKMVISPLCRL